MTTIPSSRSAQRNAQPTATAKNGASAFYLERTLSQVSRGGSPHSEAVASSEDERDIVVKKPSQAPQLVRKSSSQAMPPHRRGSWLAEVQPTPVARRLSQGGVSISSNNSQPTTPGEQAPWKNTKPAATGISYSNPFGTDTRREPPARLSEVSPSPYFGIADEVYSPSHEEPGDDGFGHYQSKNQRSQSYSVGQIDRDDMQFPAPHRGVGARASFQPLYQSSRPSGLSELREEEVSSQNLGIPLSLSRTGSRVESGPGSSALLKQAVQQQQRQRTSSASIHAGNWAPQRVQNYSEASDYAIDEADDYDSDSGAPQYSNMLGRGLVDRRFSEMTSPLRPDPFSRFSEGVRRSQWQSSLGFEGSDEGSQSRRHSFAFPRPQARNSLASSFPFTDGTMEDERAPQNSLAQPVQDVSHIGLHSPPAKSHHQTLNHDQEYAHFRTNSGDEETAIELGQANDRAFAHSYFSGYGPAMRSVAATTSGIPATASAIVNPYAAPTVARPTKHLYIVTFKCSRSDVYYIPENVGLEVKSGDMVIVEGDRGQDLGQVTHVDVTLEEARQHLKEASEQHFRWLMMFSRHVQNGTSGAVNPNGMLAASNGEQLGREGGMGPRPPTQAPQVDDLRPKMLKRLAQGHEIQVLRDKEGAEAKAKRVCQQKAIEHGLTMEILDAEYQLDYKKLTFFYYADCYINFNHLVTDLFKIYKARIWMSAVNPASFATPSNTLNQLPPPSSLGPGATSSANGAFNNNSMSVRSPYGRGAFSAPRTPGNLDVGPSATQQEYSEAPGRSLYTYASTQPYGGFNPVASAYAPTWMQSPSSAEHVHQYMMRYNNHPYFQGYHLYPGQEASSGVRGGAASPHTEGDQNLAQNFQDLSLHPRPTS
ncbi:uncharacterized protein K452DRAFT_311464 [Aplosporella prunicola CBS 121167]|uniref:PSP1 C-terminal domain-containing protein n=1 Tax=Aplosporella prunicola CBS 121167 TaxID=1176127 RepID=A0A6A6B4G9_9PEZI|nr:uncharacterized protein K452DRAFT_311464 [Aplosporella prunicola CBS 121167]KAF2138528.1 hypothetical protein K452DRAFT_311464 [Aplosporella prunicola CBS 121167]